VLVNIRQLREEQQTAIHVAPANTSTMQQTQTITTKKLIASFAALVNIPRPLARAIAKLA
jgi:hypothetical protein